MKAFILSLFALALFTGCSSVAARKAPALASVRRIYVVQTLSDNHRLDALFVAELRRHGRDASSGPRTMMPENTEAVVTYADRWKWDFRDYLIELTVEVRAPYGNKIFADARYHQPSLIPKPPAEVVREIVAQWLAE